MQMFDDIAPPKINMPKKPDDQDDKILGEEGSIAVAPEDQPELDNERDDSTETLPEKKSGKSFKKAWHSLPKRTKIIIIVSAFVLLVTASVSAFILTRSGPKVQEPVIPKIEVPPEPPKPTIVPSKLTGLPVAPEINEKAVLGVMIENSPDARPQSGLKEAGLVFEAVAEGGITRFLTLFQDTQAARIGPVRSLRPYYIDWFVPYQAAIAHAGGSGEALAQMRNEGHRDLDHGPNGAYFERSPKRFAPHNLYSSTPRLTELMTSKGYTKSEFTGLPRKEKEEPLAVPLARSIDLQISSPLYAVHYDYNAATNSYDRKNGGAVHTDAESGTQLSPKVVVALVIPFRQNGIYSVYGTVGTGSGTVYQDGNAIAITWAKESRSTQYIFTRADGTPLLLNPGQTWFTALADAGRIKHAP